MLQKIIVWGDSILKGVVLDEEKGRYVTLRDESCLALAQKKLNVEFVNRASFGMTSEKGKRLIERSLSKAKEQNVQAALIGFGGNDIDFDWAAIAQTPEKKHFPKTAPKCFLQNVEQIVSLHRQAGIQPILLTLPPIDAEKYFSWLSRNLNGENILKWLGDKQVIFRRHRSYDAIVRSAAQATGCPVVDMRAAFSGIGDLSSYICLDGIHPNARGHRLLEGALERGLPLALGSL